MTHFDILNARRSSATAIELVKSDVIRISRKPTKVFEFKDPEAFVDALIGSSGCVVYVGKDSDDSEKWRAYYWQPTYDQRKSSYGDGESLLPFGSLAILEMQSEFDLQFELEERAKQSRRWMDLWNEVQRLSRKISRIDDESKYADADRFRYMTADELETVLGEIKEQHQALTQRVESAI